MRLKADLTLLLVAMIWGSAFTAQRVAAANIGPFLFNGCRFLLGGLILLPLVRFRLEIDRRTWPWVGLAGLLLCLASVLQQAGLRWTTAGNAGFITGLYVVIIPLLLLVIWRQHVGWMTWAATLLATGGIFLISSGGKFELAPGDSLELIGALLWAAHIILVGRLMQRVEAVSFSVGQFFVAGVLNLVLSVLFDWQTASGLITAWWTVAYVGIFSTAGGYTLQAIGQKHAQPTDAALILSLEAVFAAVFGFLLLGEMMEAGQLLGCALIVGALVLSQIRPVVLHEQPPAHLDVTDSESNSA